MISDPVDAVWSLAKREDYISKVKKDPPDGNYELEFQGGLRNLPVFRVPIELPVYRLANGRTLTRQQEFIAKHTKPEDFFNDPDSAEALAAQDSLLRGMVRERGLLDYLRKVDQSYPLILTEQGYVVNGNRRLCAMRMLLAEDPSRYQRFARVRVVFLPSSSTDTDIDELEAKLQLEPDKRADYSWIDEAMLMRTRHQEHEWPLEKVAMVYNRSEKQVKEQLRMLDDADRYLTSRGHPREYSRLLKKEYAFKQLLKYRAKCSSLADEEIFTEFVYTLIDKPTEDARIYAQIPIVQSNLKGIIQTVEAELGQGLEQSPPAKGPSVELGPSDLLLGGATDVPQIPPAVTIVQSPENRSEVLTILEDAIAEANAQKQQQQNENSVLSQIRKAYTCLEAALTDLSPESNLKGAHSYLINIEEAVHKLKSKIAEYDPNKL